MPGPLVKAVQPQVEVAARAELQAQAAALVPRLTEVSVLQVQALVSASQRQARPVLVQRALPVPG